MTTFRRHYCLFIWKNYRQKARAWDSTLCEILTPVMLIVLFAVLYFYTPNNAVPSTTYECAGRFSDSGGSDFSYLPRALNATGRRLAIVGGAAADAFEAHLFSTYPGLSAADLVPLNCSGISANADFYQLVPFFPSFKNLTLKFDTEAELNSYVLDAAYGEDDAHPGIEIAVVFTTGEVPGEGAWAYRLRPNVSAIPATSTVGDPLQVGPNLDVVSNYFFGRTDSGSTKPGLVPLQLAVDRFILGSRKGSVDNNEKGAAADVFAFSLQWNCVYNPLAPDALKSVIAVENYFGAHDLLPQRVRVAPFPTYPYRLTQFYSFVSSVLALFFVMSLFFPSFNLIRGIVIEKETRIREGMRMMGMSDLAITAAWFSTYAFGIFALIATAIAVTVKASFFSRSDAGLLFVFFWLFGVSSTALCYLLSVFFSRSKVASSLGSVLFIATFFPYFKVSDPTSTGKGWASLSSSVSFGLALDVFTTYEAANIGVTWASAGTSVNGYAVSSALWYMLGDTLLYMVLALYLAAVVPQEYGVPLPFTFPLTWAHDTLRAIMRGELTWSGSKVQDDSSTALMQDSSALTSTPATGPSFEEPGPDLVELGRSGRSLAVRGVQKSFPTPDGVKLAVAGVDLDMYEGQIFALLGHNGAGKSTLISVLTGLIPPSQGDAWANGLSLSTQLAELRKTMGVW